jgi:flagellar biosynthesis/type III secretory pathway protein FliH
MLEENLDRIYRNAVAEGVLLGKLEGMQQGKLDGEAILLERQINKRFGTVSEETRTRLKTAITEQLELWADHVLDAPTLDAVFAEH